MRPVDAFYENGLLRPVSPLPLRSGERVALIVVRRPDSSRWDLARLVAHGDEDLALAEAGLEEWAAAPDREDRGGSAAKSGGPILGPTGRRSKLADVPSLCGRATR